MVTKLFPGKIMWLASYPKSGNTWFRAFLTALLRGEISDINQLYSDGMFSSRSLYDMITEIDSRDLYDEEVKLSVADVFRELAYGHDELSIIKIHDAYETNNKGEPIVPADVTHCALYFIRNQLDMAGSLANHNNQSIDHAVNMLNDKGFLGTQPNNLNAAMQTRQHISDWSGHVRSWTEQPPFPVHVVRYEDMLADTFATFSNILKFIGWSFEPGIIKQAIAASSFDVLQHKEEETGFEEKLVVGTNFFRAGKSGNWKKELSRQQMDKIVGKHGEIMKKYGYLTL